MRKIQGEFEINDDRSATDLKFVHGQLKDAYWSKGRSLQDVRKSIDHSMCFNIMHQRRQVGFARAVTDFCTVSYLMDFILSPMFRNQGLGSWALGQILEHELLRPTNFVLSTKDAMAFYAKFGFRKQEYVSMTLKRSRDR